MTKILLVFGTRPEAIKMAPLIQQLLTLKDFFTIKICVTGQHRKMLDQVIQFFNIPIDYDLDLMHENQNLFQITSDVITNMKVVLDNFNPKYILVHGDTTTSTASALAGFYSGAIVAHVEAGLRTNNKQSPFPEEMNRQLTGRIANIHFAPTASARQHLLNEGISEQNIFVTGNTVIDALKMTLNKLENYTDKEIEFLKNLIDSSKKIILITGHRRENFGQGFLNICKALKTIALEKDVHLIYPVHLNPNVKKPVYEILNGIENISLIEPLGYPAFVWLMKKSYLIVTDSGGVQEEAPSLGKPVLVLRETTERPEALEAGTIKLVGTAENTIVKEIMLLLKDENIYSQMISAQNPYGDGKASERICSVLLAKTERQ